MVRILIVDPQRCDGCGECVPACQGSPRTTSPSGAACLRIISFPGEGLWFPLVCQHCEDPSCVLTCPTGALSRDRATAQVRLEQGRCVGCGICLVSCPVGAIQLHAETKKAVKCDLCGGEPACVEKCKAGALVFSEPHTFGRARRIGAGAKIGRLIGGWR